MSARKVGDGALDLLFPKRCPWCDRVLGFAQACTCDETVRGLRFPDEALELALPDEVRGALDGVYACFNYASPVKEAYHRLKFEDERQLAAPMGAEMAKKAEGCGLLTRADVIVPVPLSAQRLAERGYNQSVLLAWEVAKRAGLPCEEGALCKTRETERQMDLGREERLTNVLGAYEVAEGASLGGRRVLLVDDVLTTGSTVCECAKTLRAAGAASVVVLTLMAVNFQK